MHEVPLSIVFGRKRPAHLLLVTKDSLPRRIYEDLHSLPGDWVVARRSGIPGLAHAGEMAALSRRLALPVQFIGDISPFDVHVFLEYRRLLAESRVSITWAGIGGSWLKRCRRRAGCFLPLVPIELRHRDELEECLRSLPEILGPDVWSVLKAGQKLTLEAASGTAAHGRGIHRFITRSLVGLG